MQSLKSTATILTLATALVSAAPGRVALAELTHGDVAFITGTAAGLVSCAATFLSWGFGMPLQVSVLLNGALVWGSDKVSVSGPVGYSPDEGYLQLAAIVVPPAPTVEADSQVRPSQIGSGNLLLADMAQAIGGLRAFNTSLDRLYTAIAAGNEEAAGRQRSHINGTLLPYLEGVMAAAGAHLSDIMDGFGDLKLTRAQIESYLESQRLSGFPPAELHAFDLLAASSCELAHGEMLLFVPALHKAEYSLLKDGLGAVSALFALTVPYLRTLNLSPEASRLRPVRGCAIFRRGDADNDGALSLDDAIVLCNYLFLGGRPLSCAEAGDVNDDGALNLSDAVHVLNWLFLGGAVPAPPGSGRCGMDPGDSPGHLGCDSEVHCI